MAKGGLTLSNMEKTKKLVAITGGIGSGKSLALSILKENGYLTLSCDKIVSDLYKERRVKVMLSQIFPDSVRGTTRLTLNKTVISQKVFNDKYLHKQLTDTITPLVMQRVLNIAKRTKQTLFVEVPLLFECGYEKHFNTVLVVVRQKRARIDAVKKRSNLTETQVLDRMNNQVNYEKLDLSNCIVLKNDGDKISFEKTLLSAVKKL